MEIIFLLVLIFLFVILAIAPIIVFIAGIAKKTIRWSSFSFNIVIFLHNVILIWFIGFVLPKVGAAKALAYYAWLPAIIGSLAFGAAILSLSYKKSPPSSAPGKASPLGWVFLIGGELAYLLGFFIANQYIFSPGPVRFDLAKIEIDVLMMNLAWFVGCALCYLASRYDSTKKPNLVRWIVMGSGFFFVAHIPSVVAVGLVSPPQNPQCFMNAHAAALLMIAYIPLMMLFTLLARDFQRPAA